MHDRVFRVKKGIMLDNLYRDVTFHVSCFRVFAFSRFPFYVFMFRVSCFAKHFYLFMLRMQSHVCVCAFARLIGNHGWVARIYKYIVLYTNTYDYSHYISLFVLMHSRLHFVVSCLRLRFTFANYTLCLVARAQLIVMYMLLHTTMCVYHMCILI